MEAQAQHYQQKLAYELDAADLYEAVRTGEPVVIVDARKEAAYQAEHIPGAISLGHRLLNEESTQHLDRSKTYVTYCDGIGCNASTKGALKLTQLGFRVKELMGGLDWWKRDGYATSGEAATPGVGTGTGVTCAC